MEYIKTNIKDVWILKPHVFEDARGYFMETFRSEDFCANLGNVVFVQDNESKSSYGVLRGLHYQISKWKAQAIEGMADLFERPNKKSEEEKSTEEEKDRLLKTIGEQKVEIDFLKKKYKQIYGYEPTL